MTGIEKTLKRALQMAEFLSAETGNPAYMLDALVRFDVVDLFRDLLNNGWYIDTETGKITPGQQGMRWDVPWIYTNPDPHRKCDLYMEIFNRCGFVPSKCMDCWKVVAKPRTVDELMRLLVLQAVYSKNHMGVDRWCKCGVEERGYVPQGYGGYFYCDSKAQGLERYKDIRNLVSKSISPDVPVILKRYCTEFELRLGPTDTYKRPPFADAIEHEIMENIDRDKPNTLQPPAVVRHILRRWAEFAWARGDMSVKGVFNGGQPLYSSVVTYHQEAGLPEPYQSKGGI